jgi:8-oxo-dGTP diphosphatase
MTPVLPFVLVAAAALLDSDGRVLIAQRPPGKAMAGLWEFPGGKIEDGESPEQALVRELQEELGIGVKPPCLAPFTFASHTYESFRLLMPLFVCRRWDGTPQPLLHSALKWIRPRELIAQAHAFPMPAADLPLLPMLRDLL